MSGRRTYDVVEQARALLYFVAKIKIASFYLKCLGIFGAKFFKEQNLATKIQITNYFQNLFKARRIWRANSNRDVFSQNFLVLFIDELCYIYGVFSLLTTTAMNELLLQLLY